MVGTSGIRVVAVAADIPVETEHGLEAEEGLEDRLESTVRFSALCPNHASTFCFI